MKVGDACRAAFKNRRAVLGQEQASCYFCIRSFPSLSIRDWTDNRQTALCPNCGIDSVLPGEIEKATLAEMNEQWFCRPADNETGDL